MLQTKYNNIIKIKKYIYTLFRFYEEVYFLLIKINYTYQYSIE